MAQTQQTSRRWEPRVKSTVITVDDPVHRRSIPQKALNKMERVLKILDASLSPNTPFFWHRASQGSAFAAILLCLLFPMPGLADATNCKESYNRSVEDLERVYSETVNSMLKNARLNNLNIAKELSTMRQDHNRNLEQARQFYNECVARADRQERERREAKERADKIKAREIESQVNQLRNNNSVRQFNSQSWDNQRNTLLNSDPKAFQGQAEQLEERARQLRNQSLDALRNGDFAISRELNIAAAELNSQAGAARTLGTRATMEQQGERFRIESEAKKAESDRYWAEQRAKNKSESDRYWAAQEAKDQAAHEAQMKRLNERPVLRAYDGSPSTPQTFTFTPSGSVEPRRTFRDEVIDNAPDTVFESVRDGIEDDTGFRTRVPGERIATKPLEYIDEAQGRARTVDGLGNPVSDTIQKKMLPKIDNYLNHPNAEPRRADPSRGSSSGSSPSSSGGSPRTFYLPPFALPQLAPPSARQPLSEQQVEADFQKLRGGAGGPRSIPQPNRIPLVNMPSDPKPNATPPPAPSTDSTVPDIFKKWLDGLSKPAPAPSPSPTPPPNQPVDQFGSPSKR